MAPPSFKMVLEINPKKDVKHLQILYEMHTGGFHGGTIYIYVCIYLFDIYINTYIHTYIDIIYVYLIYIYIIYI